MHHFEFFSITVYVTLESIFMPTPPAEMGVETNSKLYPGIAGLEVSLAFLILVSLMPITLK